MPSITPSQLMRTGLRLIKKGIMQVESCLSSLWLLEARLVGIQCGSGVHFVGRAVLGRHEGSSLILEDGVCIRSSLRSNPLGCFQPSVLRTLTPEARLHLGKNVGISSTVLCAARSITVGEGTIMGAGAMIIDNDFHAPEGEWGWGNASAENARPVVIGRGVFIGARAMVLKGVSIGDRAIVGAGAVVSCDVPAGALAVGNPARIILRGAKPPAPSP